MSAARSGFRFWFTYEAAVLWANGLARREGRRYRVQRVTWETGARGNRWYVAPTPADYRPKVLEPCS